MANWFEKFLASLSPPPRQQPESIRYGSAAERWDAINKSNPRRRGQDVNLLNEIPPQKASIGAPRGRIIPPSTATIGAPTGPMRDMTRNDFNQYGVQANPDMDYIRSRGGNSGSQLASFDEDVEEIDEQTPAQEPASPTKPLIFQALRPQVTRSGQDVNLPFQGSANQKRGAAAKRNTKSFDIPSPGYYSGLDAIDMPGHQFTDPNETYADMFAEEMGPEPENASLKAYREHLGQFPSRDQFKPHWWDKIAASLQAVGGQDPYQHINRKYNERVADWQLKGDALETQANLDYKINNPLNDLKAANIESQINDRRGRFEQGNRRLDISEQFVAAKIASMERSGFRPIVANDGEVIMVRGKEEIPTGITSLDYARFTENQFSTRQRLRQGNQRIQQGDERNRQGRERIDLLRGGEVIE